MVRSMDTPWVNFDKGYKRYRRLERRPKTPNHSTYFWSTSFATSLELRVEVHDINISEVIEGNNHGFI
jgi:hypothetical protein